MKKLVLAVVAIAALLAACGPPPDEMAWHVQAPTAAQLRHFCFQVLKRER